MPALLPLTIATSCPGSIETLTSCSTWRSPATRGQAAGVHADTAPTLELGGAQAGAQTAQRAVERLTLLPQLLEVACGTSQRTVSVSARAVAR